MKWTTAYINKLPDSAFAFIEPGGEKDEDGKTTPRSLRHLPYKDTTGKIDAPHLRNALARVSQTKLTSEQQGKARKVLLAAVKQIEKDQGVVIKVAEEELKHKKKLAQEQVIDSETKVDRKNWIIKDVSMLGQYSPNVRGGRTYLDSALNSATTALEGVRALFSHSYGRRVFNELLGIFREVRREGDRVRGNLHVLDHSEEGGGKLMNVAEKAPDAVGFSVDADIAYKEIIGGGEEVHEIVNGRSVDLVLEPATTKGIFESCNEDEINQEPQIITREELNDLQTKIDQVTEEFIKFKESDKSQEEQNEMDPKEEIKRLQESVNRQEADVKRLTEELDKEQMARKKVEEELATYKTREAEGKRKSVIEEKLKAANLPEWAITDVFRKQVQEAKDEKEIDAIIEDRKIVTAKREYEKIPAGTTDDKETDTKGVTEEEVKEAMLE